MVKLCAFDDKKCKNGGRHHEQPFINLA